MNTFTHVLASINWIDVAILVLFIRIVFIGVKTGFVTEFFKLLGIFLAAFVGLHYYSSLAVLVTKKTNWSIESLEFVFFVLLFSLIVIVIKFLRDGFLVIFKFESTHAAFNQWGAGVLAIARVLLLSSLIMYGLLLTRVEWLQRQTLMSVSSKIALKAAPYTYSFFFNKFIGKFFPQEKLNQDIFNVISRNSVDRKPF